MYHANYLRYMERARTEFLRSLGLEQRKMHLEGAPVIVVSSIEMKFVRPAVLDDALTVKTRIKLLRRASVISNRPLCAEKKPSAQRRCVAPPST